MDITVFYAWQSDSPVTVNWHLIRTAAEQACSRITADTSNDWDVSLDFSTKGVVGMCDIPQEILKKIRECDIFLADLTLVGATPKGKQLPNSNAVFELGYAAGRHSFRSLIGVVNEAYGKIEGQVFDIKRRASLRYKVKESSTPERIAKVTAELSEALEDVIRDIIELWVIPRRARRDDKSRGTYEEANAEFTRQVAASSFYNAKTLPAVTHTISFKWPKAVDFESVIRQVRRMAVNPEFSPEAVVWAETLTIAEIRKEGVLRRASINDATSARNQAAMTGHIESGQFLFADYLQKNLVLRIDSDIRFLVELGVKGPWFVGAALAGGKDVVLVDLGGIPAPRKLDSNELNLPIVKISSLDQLARLEENAGEFIPALNWFARSVGWPRSNAILADGTWAVRTVARI